MNNKNLPNMTKKELIELLKDVPDDYNIRLWDNSWRQTFPGQMIFINDEDKYVVFSSFDYTI